MLINKKQDLTNLQQLEFSFDKFMKETLRKESAKPKLDGKVKETNPNKEFENRYHEGVAGCMWIGAVRYTNKIG